LLRGNAATIMCSQICRTYNPFGQAQHPSSIVIRDRLHTCWLIHSLATTLSSLSRSHECTYCLCTMVQGLPNTKGLVKRTILCAICMQIADAIWCIYDLRQESLFCRCDLVCDSVSVLPFSLPLPAPNRTANRMVRVNGSNSVSDRKSHKPTNCTQNRTWNLTRNRLCNQPLIAGGTRKKLATGQN
jgi:hypothetical protein